MAASNQAPTNNDCSGILNALRGFYGHVKMASIGLDVNWVSPILPVEGFMPHSGLLMANHWIFRHGKFDSCKVQAKDFYDRRFFWIALLCDGLLTVAFVFQNKLFAL